jgi:hypothetical protein
MRARLLAISLLAPAACAAEGAGAVPVQAPSTPVSEGAPRGVAATDTGDAAGETRTLLSPPGGGFSVRVPVPPHEDEVESAPLTMHVFESVAKGDVVYTVAYTDYPADFPAASDPDRLLDAARDALVESQGGTLTFEARIALDTSTPGRELAIRRGDRAVTVRLYATGLRVFELSVAAPENADVAGPRAAFFDSFSLAPR